MGESSDLGTSIVSLVPEFYYDLIARVVPGVAVLELYEFVDTEHLNFATISLGIVAAYLVGLALDVSTERLAWFLHLITRPLTDLIAFFRIQDDEALWNWTRTLPLAEQVQLKKMFAEKVLFRVAFFVALFSAVKPPPILENQHHRIAISLSAAALSLLCLYTLYLWMGFIKASGRVATAEAPKPTR